MSMLWVFWVSKFTLWRRLAISTWPSNWWSCMGSSRMSMTERQVLSIPITCWEIWRIRLIVRLKSWGRISYWVSACKQIRSICKLWFASKWYCCILGSIIRENGSIKHTKTYQRNTFILTIWRTLASITLVPWGAFTKLITAPAKSSQDKCTFAIRKCTKRRSVTRTNFTIWNNTKLKRLRR